MARKKLILKSNSRVEVGKQIHDIMADKLLREVRTILGKNLDLEVSKIFKFISSQMLGKSNFGVIRPYLARPWGAYSAGYRRRKAKSPGHLRWFNLTGKLSQEFGGVSEETFLKGVGHTKVSFSREGGKITARMAPKLRLTRNNLEEQLGDANLLSAEAVMKLQGRVEKHYRPMVGPVFQYFVKQRLPQVIRRTIKGK